MAIAYSRSVATANYGSFFRLLCRWKGSVYKLIWVDVVVFIILYTVIALAYHLSPISSPELLEFHKRIQDFLKYVQNMCDSLPVSFILGFFVTLVVGRWIDQFSYLPTSDGVGLLTSAYIQIPARSSNKKVSVVIADEVTVIRQSIARYINLAAVLCFQTIAPNVRKVYENTQNYISSGLMTEKEHEFFGQIDPRYHPFYVPLMWAITLVKRAKVHGYIAHERHMNALIDEILKFRLSLFTLLNYDSVPIPLVYTQVVNIGVYAIFLITLVGSQFPRELPVVPDFSTNATVPPVPTTPEFVKPILYVPVFSLLNVTFYLGWLKVAQSLLNPFGDDDEDFDLLPLMERNLAISLWMVDLRHGMPTQAAEDSGEQQDEKQFKRLSFVKPTDTLFFKQTGPLGNLVPDSGDPEDPLTELLASAAELQVPNSLAPVGGTNFDESGLGTGDWTGPKPVGSAAVAFERRESRRFSFMGSDDGGPSRKHSSMAAFVNRIRRRSIRLKSPSRQQTSSTAASPHLQHSPSQTSSSTVEEYMGGVP